MAAKLVKYKVKVSFVSDRWAPAAGQIIEAPPDVAEDWERAGFVEVYEEIPAPRGKKAAGEVETAALPGAPETAVGAGRKNK